MVHHPLSTLTTVDPDDIPESAKKPPTPEGEEGSDPEKDDGKEPNGDKPKVRPF